MQNTKITNSNSLPDEVKIDLNVFNALMLNRVGCHVDCTDVVAVHQCGTPERSMQLQKKLAQPGGLSNSISHRAILGFSATPLATVRYSASALDLDTVFWRLEDQEMRLSPRNIA
jgi:hypothetical protein